MYRTVRGLALPLAITIFIIFAVFGSALAGNKTAPVEIGFMAVPPVTARFQNVLLNVQAIRLNRKANAAPDDPNWQRIGVSPIISGGGNGTPELQIDLNNSQDIPQLFNIGKIKPGTYHIAQLILDSNNPGTLIPDCPGAPNPEGCINYPVQLADAGAPINLISTSGPLISASNTALTVLMIKLTMTINTPPVTPGAPYLVSITMDPVCNSATCSVTGTVTGNVPGGSGSTAKHLRRLQVAAEAIGTNNEIAVTPVDSKGGFTLSLPAAGGPGDATTFFGTLYDLAVSGGADSYAAIRLQPLIPTGSLTANFKNILTNQTLGVITGTVTDFCAAKTPIVGATLQLLIPPQNNPAVTPATCLDPATADQCVSVATANTDNAGNFPLPGTLLTPSAFLNVPILKAGTTYAMKVTAPGYDTLITPVNATNGNKVGGNCSTSKTVTACNLLLKRGTITGTIPIESIPSGQTTVIEVFAEDAGTNNIVGALPMPIVARSGSTSVGFSVNVPTGVDRHFDLFATTIDLFQGLADPYQGHSIVVIPDVLGPATPTTPGVCDSTGPAAATDVIKCVGHGSMTGSVTSGDANLGTSVSLLKGGVQITNTPVQNQSGNGNPNPTNSFAFCAPGDTYDIQLLQLPRPAPSVTPLAAPTPALTGSPVAVTIPLAPLVGGPKPTPTPALKCPTTCQNLDGTCPGVCFNAGLGTVL